MIGSNIDESRLRMRVGSDKYPQVEIIEEALREGMQIESASITVDDKLRLIDALADAGLRTIVVGSFVSPRWSPQMADIDDLVRRVPPREGVRYTALALNERGRERLRAACPPLVEPDGPPRTMVHLCDVFVQRNTGRSQQAEIDDWPRLVARAVEWGAGEAGIGINAAWGSNWVGEFTLEDRMSLLRAQHDVWAKAGVPVTSVWIGDPMGWNVPDQVAEQLVAIMAEWPDIRRIHLHLHNARGTAPVSAYAAITTLSSAHKLVFDTTIGGIGGCPYGGHGRLTRMIPTEDLVDLCNELGIPTGIEIDKLIDAADLASAILGKPLYGHVSGTGPRPRGKHLYPMDLPFIETEQEAQHFRLGPSVYAGARSPWTKQITSSMRKDIEARRGPGM